MPLEKEKGTETPLKGAVFGLYTAEDIKSKDGKVLIEKDTLVEQKTTDVDGKIAFIANLLSYSFTFVNEPTTVEPSKTDITDGKELPGAHLRVIDENANLIETNPADGYATAESVSFKIENTGEVQKVKMEDDVTKVRLSKSDITTGKEVPGAKLTILGFWASAEDWPVLPGTCGRKTRRIRSRIDE